MPVGAALVCQAEVVSGGNRLAFVEASMVATVAAVVGESGAPKAAEDGPRRPGHLDLRLPGPD